MQGKEILDTIKFWTTWAQENNVSNYDIAILKIWIKFEKYLGEVFLKYSIGQPSELGYKPRLKISFADESHFNAFMKDKNRKYIDYLDKIENLSEHIFIENPFNIILLDVERTQNFKRLKCLRNYIAHESEEARRKVIQQCFGGDEKKFKEPNEYLKSKPKNSSDSYYTIYIKLIAEVVEAINSKIEE